MSLRDTINETWVRELKRLPELLGNIWPTGYGDRPMEAKEANKAKEAPELTWTHANTRWPLVARAVWQDGGATWNAGLWARGASRGLDSVPATTTGVLVVARDGYEVERLIGVRLDTPNAALTALVRQAVARKD